MSIAAVLVAMWCLPSRTGRVKQCVIRMAKAGGMSSLLLKANQCDCMVHAPQHGFLDFAPIGGERVNVRVSPTRVVALSGSMSVDDGLVSGKVFVHLLSSEGGTDWLELKANGVRKGALADLVAALAKAPTV